MGEMDIVSKNGYEVIIMDIKCLKNKCDKYCFT